MLRKVYLKKKQIVREMEHKQENWKAEGEAGSPLSKRASCGTGSQHLGP